jgi:heat shock protein HspQ
MAAQNRDQGLDPLQGNYEEKTHAVNEVSLNLREGQWYHVILESVGDKMCLQVDGQTVIAQHVGFTEKKDNFGFQAGGFDTHLYIDNVRVREAIPKR